MKTESFFKRGDVIPDSILVIEPESDRDNVVFGCNGRVITDGDNVTVQLESGDYGSVAIRVLSPSIPSILPSKNHVIFEWVSDSFPARQNVVE